MSTINDLVLVYLDRQPAFLARVNDITPDVKKGWYQVELLALTLPTPNPDVDPERRPYPGRRVTPWAAGR